MRRSMSAMTSRSMGWCSSEGRGGGGGRHHSSEHTHGPRQRRRLPLTSCAPKKAPGRAPRAAASASGADEASRPPEPHQIGGAGRLGREPLVELLERPRKVLPAHGVVGASVARLHHNILYLRERNGYPIHTRRSSGETRVPSPMCSAFVGQGPGGSGKMPRERGPVSGRAGAARAPAACGDTGSSETSRAAEDRAGTRRRAGSPLARSARRASSRTRRCAR